MNNKKIQSQMQINVSFIGDATKMLKTLEKDVSNLNLSSTLTKGLETNLNKTFQSLYSNLDKMSEGLSKKGLSAKQYTDFFEGVNKKVGESTKLFGTLKDSLQSIFNSDENKKAIKDLEDYKKQLVEINKLVTAQKGAETRKNTAIQKMRDETGIDYNIQKRSLSAIAGRRADKKSLTKNQQDWLTANGLDEKSLNRALELLKQIRTQTAKINDINTQGKTLTGQSNIIGAQEFTQKRLDATSNIAYTNQAHKENLSILTQEENKYKSVDSLSTKLYSDLSAEIPRATAEAEKLAKASSTINDILSQFGIGFSAYAIAAQFKQLIDYSYEFYRSLDSALNEIYVVSDLSINKVNELTGSFINMAAKTGMAIDDVTRAAVLFYQQGLSTNEVLEMTEVTSQFAKVAGIDAADAADKLTAAVNGYCLAAEDASSVADKFNKVAAVSAADINELSTAFSKAAAQANQAGVSMDNYLAYIATMEEATREAPENIGTSLKTIFSRMDQIKTGNNTEDTTDVNDVETALKSVGVSLRDTQGQLRDLEDVFDELGPKWNQLDRNTQAYLGTIIAGTRQQSRFVTLMQNWDRVLELSAESENSAGQQALMHAKAMDSITSKTQQLTVAWQEFISNLGDNNIIKGAISTLTQLIKLFNTKPLALMTVGVIAMRKQINELAQVIGVKLINSFKNLKLTALSNPILNKKAEISVDKKMSTNRKTYSENVANLSVNREQQNQIQQRLDEAKEVGNLQGIATYQLKVNQLKEEEGRIIEQNKRLEQEQGDLINRKANIQKQKNASLNKGQAVGSLIGGIGTAAGIAGTLIPGDAGAAVSSIGNIAGGVGKLIATGGMDIGAWLQTVMGAVEGIKLLVDTFTNVDEKIGASVSNIKSSLENVENTTLQVKGAESLVKDYQKLSNQIHLTATEQEKLNSTAQKLADSLDLDAVEDDYGNLTINIEEVNAKIAELEKNRKQALEDYRKTEAEEMEKFDGTSKRLTKFMNENLKSNAAELKNISQDIKVDIDESQLLADSKTIDKITDELKDNIINHMKDVGTSFKDNMSTLDYLENELSDINDKVDDDSWNNLYGKVTDLSEKTNELTYGEISRRLDDFFDNWAAKANLTTKEMEALRKSVESTIYGNSNIDDLINSDKDILNRSSTNYYDKLIADQKKIVKQKKYTMNNNGEWDAWNPFYKSDDEAEYEQAKRELKVYENKKQSLIAIQQAESKIQQLQEGTYQFSEQELLYGESKEQATERMLALQEQIVKSKYEELGLDKSQIDLARQRQEILPNLTKDTSDALDKAGILDFEGITNENGDTIYSSYDMLKSIDYEKLNKAFAESNQKGMNMLFDTIADQINNTSDAKVKEAWQNRMDDMVSSMSLVSSMSWSDLGKQLDTITESYQKMNDVLADFAENGHISADNVTDFFEVLDNFEVSSMNPDQINQYLSALDNLKIGYDAATGSITANGKALQSLQQIQEMQAQAEIEQTKQGLMVKAASLDAQIVMYQAQIDANNSVISQLEDNIGEQVELDKIKTMGDQAMVDANAKAAETIGNNYKALTQDSATWAEATIQNIAKVGDAFNALANNQISSQNAVSYVKNLVTETKWSGYESADLEGLSSNGKIDAQTAIDALKERNKAIENSKNVLEAEKKKIFNQISLLDQIGTKGLGKWGGSGKSDSDDLKEYEGKLEKIYNILNRIDMLEHRHSMLESYFESGPAEEAGDYLQSMLNYSNQLVDQYSFLTSEQKKFANGWKEAIQNSAVSQAFSFDEFGQIIINWEEYNKLSNVATKNTKSLKEQADELYDSYKDAMDSTKDYMDKLIAAQKQVISENQKILDAYVEMENKAADAVKEIYQKILDTKLDAIDKEKEAIEDLRKAREQDRTDQENAKAVSGLQTNIQRAMMDTSGASDVALIKAQQDLDDKLSDIAEDKYSDMLDNIIDHLEEQANALQDEFDEMFSNLEWLYSMLEADIMGDSERMLNILEQTEEWNTLSPIERQKRQEEWQRDMDTYMEALKGGKQIGDVYNSILDAQSKLTSLESVLKTDVVNAINSSAQSIASSVGSAVSSAYSRGYSAGGGGLKSTTTPNSASKNNTSNTITITLNDGYKNSSIKTVQSGSSITLPALSRSGYTFQGWDVPSQGLCSSPRSPYTYKPTRSETVTALWSPNASSKASSSKTNNKSYFPTLTNPFNNNFGKLTPFANGGKVYTTGPAWLDGTQQKPEAVLTSLQTEHFIQFTDAIDKIAAGGVSTTSTGTVNIDNIQFNVESMSSAEDGEAAFNMFVNKFKEIGNQTGIKVNTFKNTL